MPEKQEMPEKPKQIVLENVWRTCNKIRAALFRTGLNLCDIYKPLDRNCNSLISESKFVSVLKGQLKRFIPLSEQEICDLADYFKVQDGRILYTQFCRVIRDSDQDLSKKKPLVTGSEWEDPFHCNVLSVTEERKLKLLLTKMATIVNSRNMLFQPYFQDYELIAKNNGSMTLAHFARTLNFLKIHVSSEDFHLLTKKFLKDGYTINYVAFLAAINAITENLIEGGNLDVGGDLLSQFPGRTIIAELPKLPRPEIGNIRSDKVFGAQKVFHPVLDPPPEFKPLREVILRIQKYVLAEGVRIGEFFKDFDKLNSGRVSESAFRRSLEMVGIGTSGTRKLYFSTVEIEELINLYRDPNDPARIMWRVFECDIDSVFAYRGLEKWPEADVVVPPPEVQNLSKPGNRWDLVEQKMRDECEEVVSLIRMKISCRRLFLRPSFNDLDKKKNGHVSRRQFRTILSIGGILLTDEQLYALEQRYNDDMGFDYFRFLAEVEPEMPVETQFQRFMLERARVNEAEYKPPVKDIERDILEILAKIKRKLSCYRIRLADFMVQFDVCNQLTISANDFRRSLDPKLDLTPTEVEIIIDVFASPNRPGHVDYRRFCDVVEETFIQKQLERSPLIEPVPHLSIEDGEHNFLNYEERQIVSLAMHKLAKTPNYGSALLFFQDLDQEKNGIVQDFNVLRALKSACLHTVISPSEVKVIKKCFSKPKGSYYKVFDYRAFLNAIDVVANSIKFKPI